jgi:hypothetical protein
MASASPMSSSSFSDIVAGRQDLQQIAAGDLLPGSAGRSHEGLVNPGDRRRLARRDLAARERCRDRIHRSRQVLRRRFVNFAVADGRERRQREPDRAFMARGSTRSRHSFIANMSPASAASTAPPVNPKASPSSKVAAASVALAREPRRRPAGLPDRPGWNSRLRPRAGGRGTISSLIELLRGVTYFVFIYGIWHCVNSNRAPSAAHDPSQIRRDCGTPYSARRSLFASLKVLSGRPMTTGTRSVCRTRHAASGPRRARRYEVERQPLLRETAARAAPLGAQVALPSSAMKRIP